MGLVTCAGADVLRGRIALPLRGAWTADLVLDAATAPAGFVEMTAANGLSLKGTVLSGHAGVHLDAAHVRLVGGRGGLAKEVSGAYRSAQLRDPLGTLTSASGEQLSATVASEIMRVALASWTLGRYGAGRALDELVDAAAAALGKPVNWRVLSDGSLWLGAEAWPAATLPVGADVIERFPAERRVVIGAETPALLPGVDLADVGKVIAVEHVLAPNAVRTVAWT